MPRSDSRAHSLADQLLEAQVRHHLERLSTDDLATTVAAAADDLLDATDAQPLDDLLDREAVKAVAARLVRTVPGSAAASALVEVVTSVAYAGPPEPYPIGELVERERVEALVDGLLALHPVVERALDRLTASPLVGTVASRFMGRIVGEVLQANRAVADKVPGLGSLMAFGTSAASKVMGAADKQFEGLIGDTVGKGGTFAVRRLNNIVLETLRDPTTREAALQVWDLVAAQEVVGLEGALTPQEISGVVDAVHELVVSAAAGERVGHLTEVLVDAFFDRFGGHSVTELLAELDLDRKDVVADLVRLAPCVVEAMRASGELERIVRARLKPFYASAEVRELLG